MSVVKNAVGRRFRRERVCASKHDTQVSMGAHVRPWRAVH
jgi:hypothetical protein